MATSKRFFKVEGISGILLFVFAVLAMLTKNSDFSELYNQFLMSSIEIRAESFSIDKPFILWLNDGIMAIFFFVIGLELKKELIKGRLADARNLVLPFAGAIGGVMVPALIYFWLNKDNQLSAHGWAIPTATDIAFALGVLALLGDRIPTSLKLFLMTLAIIDDLFGILVIAFFYTEHISTSSLLLAIIGLVGLATLNKLNVYRIAPYLLFGIFIWLCFLKSGVHATIAGVINAFFIPIRGHKDRASEDNPLEHLLHNLHPYVAFAILPLFAFANAGVDLSEVNLQNLTQDIPLGIILGLFLGKQIGVFGMSYLFIKLKLCKLPDQATWLQLYGTAVLCGIGFTMSLFIGSLAFAHGGAGEARIDRLAILIGSVLSAIVGYLILKYAKSNVSPL